MQFSVTLKGQKQAKGELKDIIDTAKDADRQRERISKSEGVRQRGETPRGGGAGGGSSIRDIALGNLLGNGIQRAFSAFGKSVTSAFDSNLTRTEREVATVQAGLSSIPFVGEAASGLVGNALQVETGTAQGTAQRLNSLFGGAFRAFGAANPNLRGEDLENALRERFGDQIERARQFYEPQERAQEVGSQLIATDDKGLDSADLENVASRELKRISKKLDDYFGFNLDDIKGVFNGDAINNTLEGIRSDFTEGLDDLQQTFTDGFERLQGIIGIGDNGG